MRAGLILACLLFGAIAVVQWWVWPIQSPSTSGSSGSALSRGKPHEAATGAMPQFRLPPEAHFQEIKERPLFVKGRRLSKPDSTAKPTSKDNPLPNHLGLTAVMVTKDGPSALIVDRAEKKTLNLKTGDDLAGWEIVSIRPDHLVLSLGESRQQMPLRVFDASPPPPPPAPNTTQSKSKPAAKSTTELSAKTKTELSKLRRKRAKRVRKMKSSQQRAKPNSNSD